jgi:hypothetical protein
MRYHFAVALKDVGQRPEAIRLLSAIVTDKRDFPEKAAAGKLLETLRRGS